MRSRTGFLVMLLSAVVLSAPVSARTFVSQTFTCPLTGTTFKANVDASGTQFCQRLDLKPIGFIGAPGVVPECPDDGLVLYQDTFTRAQLKILRPWVKSEHYQQVLRQESTHFRIAETMKQLSAPADEVAWAYVRASWQVEDQPQRYRRYLGAAMDAMTLAIEQHSKSTDKDAKLTTARLQILGAELSRRLGQMPQAEQWLAAAEPALSSLPEDDRYWHAAVLARVRVGFVGKAYFTDDDARCAHLDQE